MFESDWNWSRSVFFRNVVWSVGGHTHLRWENGHQSWCVCVCV